jgi:hypothetical protein
MKDSTKIKTLAKVGGGLLFAVTLAYTFEAKTILYLIIALLVVCIILVYKSRQNIKVGMQNIETRIWGKPLEKDFWNKGEMKNTKVKFVWKKQRENIKDQ